MSTLEELPPDQRAALSLLLTQGKSYAELAKVLGIPERAVHDRARRRPRRACAPRGAAQVPAERREEIGDYLLGQQRGMAERLETRTYLGSDEPARTWAAQLAGELGPLAGGALPDIPVASTQAAERNGAGEQPPPGTAPGAQAPSSSASGAAGRSGASPLPSSRSVARCCWRA